MPQPLTNPPQVATAGQKAAEGQRDSALAALEVAEGAKLSAEEKAAGLMAEKAALDGQVG